MVSGDLSGFEGELSSAAGATAFDAWPALGMLVQLVVTSPGRLEAARELLEADLTALDLACSRFRGDSELVAIGNFARGASSPVTVAVSPLLADAVAVSLRAAQLTDGDVDPTVGGCALPHSVMTGTSLSWRGAGMVWTLTLTLPASAFG